MAIDVDRLMAEALNKHGIRLDPHDPAVVLVTLNRLVLEEAARSIATDIRAATIEFEQAASRVQSRFGAVIASRLKAAVTPATVPLAESRRTWLAVGLACGGGIFLIGVAVGKWVLS